VPPDAGNVTLDSDLRTWPALMKSLAYLRSLLVRLGAQDWTDARAMNKLLSAHKFLWDR
jgi:hypothetical protein